MRSLGSPSATDSCSLTWYGTLLEAQTCTRSLVVEPYEAGVGLQVSLVLSRHRKSVLDDEVRLGKALVDIALAPRIPGKGIEGLSSGLGSPI